jgi:hypothetical protein
MGADFSPCCLRQKQFTFKIVVLGRSTPNQRVGYQLEVQQASFFLFNLV